MASPAAKPAPNPTDVSPGSALAMTEDQNSDEMSENANPGGTESQEGEGENLQGPHDWRRRLKPTRLGSREGSVEPHPEGVTEGQGPEPPPHPTGQERLETGGAGDERVDNHQLNNSPVSDCLNNSHEVEQGEEEDQQKGLVSEDPVEEKGDERSRRERMKNVPIWKRDIISKRIKALRAAGQGLNAFHQSPIYQTQQGPGHHRRARQTHAPTESAFTRQVVNKPTSPGLGRRKVHIVTTPSQPPQTQPPPTGTPRSTGLTTTTATPAATAWEKKPGLPSSMVAGGRRGIAHTVTPEPNGAAAKRRVEKVLKARLYLLQQNGPNSFLIGGDSPDHKYRVIIGPQRCSCGRGAHCVHIMFVMLRVFQVNENDPSLWCKTLKNYEVEALFRTFHERRSSLIQNLSRRKKQKALKENVETESKSSSDSGATTPSTGLTDEADHKEEHDEEENCPICLLEMVEGESLTECVNGCQNKLHHHCIAVWFEECRRQSEPLICPLCRATWKVDHNAEGASGTELPVPPNTRVSSPSHEQPEHQRASEAEVILPHAEPVPPEHQQTAAPWIPLLGEELVSCLFSKNWMVREIAVKQLGRVAVGALLLGVGEGRAGVILSPDRQATTRQMLETCCSVLAYVCTDPVYKVFVATLRTLRTVLAFTPCRDDAQQTRLKCLLMPVIDGILLKCADSNKRTSQLSMSAMQELLKGQEGELSLGREIVNPGDLGLGGLPYLLSCVTRDYNPASVQYQWLLGRLAFLHKVLEDHSSEFLLKAPEQSELTDKQCPLEDYDNYERVMAALRFTRGALENAHQNVARMARHVFYQIARLQSHNAAALKHVTDLLDTLGLNIQVQLKRKLLARMTADFRFSQRSNSKWLDTEELGKTCDTASGVDGGLPNTPQGSGHSSPRCASPQTSATPPHISVTVNNFVSGNLNFVPMAPPNSPERRSRPEGRSRSGTETDSPASGATSSVETMDCPDGLFGEHHYNHRHRSHSGTSSTHNHHRSHSGASSSVYASTPQKERPAKVDVSVSTSPTLAIRGINFNLSTSLGESSTDDLEISGVTMTIDSNEQDDLAADLTADLATNLATDLATDLATVISSEDDVVTTTTEVSSLATFDDELEAVHNTTLESVAVQTANTSLSHPSVGGAVCGDSASSVLSTDATVASGSSTGALSGSSTGAMSGSSTGALSSSGMLSEDLSDPTDSPSGADFHVSFKTEVAFNSPNTTPARQAPPIVVQTARVENNAACPCKEEVEREEAQALAAAMEQSEIQQNPLPYIPGLSQQSLDESIKIRIQHNAQLPNGERTIIDFHQHSMPQRCHPSSSSTDCKDHEDPDGDYREGVHWVRGPMLGTGAFSTCYQARDIKTGALVAVKQISFCRNSLSEQEEVMDAVREEIGMMSRLNHPNVVRILGATQQANHFFMFVEWMPGGSVAYLLDRYGVFSENVIIKYTQQVLRGIAYLHETHILHRDLKGANLLVDSTGERVRIADFGAAARLASRQTMGGEFQGQLLGTIAFMAPEIASSVDAPPIPENLSPPVRDLMLRCLECRRDDRPPAKELLKHPLFTLLTKT